MAAAVASQPARSEATGKQFWRSSNYDEAYWDAYVAARPQYQPDLYTRIISYYREHNPSPPANSVAHDAGTGPGQMAGELCKYFNHVVGSDINNTHTEVAAVRLHSLRDQLSWSALPAEELGDKFPAGSANLVTSAQALALTDIPRVMDSFTRLLAPNGTLAVIFYSGRPRFYNAEVASLCQPILDNILRLIVAGPLQSAGEGQKAFWKRACDTVFSQFDNVPFPEKYWRDVRRHKWSTHLPLSSFDESVAPFHIDRSSAINPGNEKVIVEDPRLLFREEWSFKEIKAFCECQLPNLEDLKANKELWSQVEAQYKELEKAMDGRKSTLFFPAVLLLATRT